MIRIVKCVKCQKNFDEFKSYLTVDGYYCDKCYSKAVSDFSKNVNKIIDKTPDIINNKNIYDSDE